ncbi:MAG: DUF4350 domain-containing protein, partial [Pseudonocardiaceae bacterium]
MTTTETSVSSDAGQLWRAARGPVAIVTLVVAVGIAVALLSGLGDGGALDPRSADPSGTRALARLLQG